MSPEREQSNRVMDRYAAQIKELESKVEKADKFREKIAMRLRRVNAAFTATKIQRDSIAAQRDNLKSLCEKLGTYTIHTGNCQVYKHTFDDPRHKCTCGLDELLKQGEK